MPSPLDKFMASVEKTDGCWRWLGARMPRGYGRFYFNGMVRYAHRVSMELLKGVAPGSDDIVMHSCDNPSCVNPDHLIIGTQKMNMRDAYDKGRMRSNRKLSEEQRLDLERSILSGKNSFQVSSEFGISSSRVRNIAREMRARGGSVNVSNNQNHRGV